MEPQQQIAHLVADVPVGWVAGVLALLTAIGGGGIAAKKLRRAPFEPFECKAQDMASVVHAIKELAETTKNEGERTRELLMAVLK